MTQSEVFANSVIKYVYDFVCLIFLGINVREVGYNLQLLTFSTKPGNGKS